MGWLYDALTNESRWIAPSLAIAALLAFRALRRTTADDPRRTSGALNVLAGGMIGCMALGHLFAVLLKLAAADLNGSLPVLLGIGIVLAVPSWLVFAHGWALARGEAAVGRRTFGLNLTLAGALLVTGPLNAPLAIPAVLNSVYAGVHHGRTRQVTAVVTVIFCLVLFAGSVRFFLSGQSFEDFSGMDAPVE